MFTGIIQARGSVTALEGSRLRIEVPSTAWNDEIAIGESIAVNGCCLTVVGATHAPEFDLSDETLKRTTFGSLEPGTFVNLERALTPSGRMGGHFVQGHVDGVAELVSRRVEPNGEVFRFRVPADGSKYLAPKGSIALDGISLTIVDPTDTEFDVWVIPHTIEMTNLGSLEPGARVHVEYDMLAKYLERLLGNGGR